MADRMMSGGYSPEFQKELEEEEKKKTMPLPTQALKQVSVPEPTPFRDPILKESDASLEELKKQQADELKPLPKITGQEQAGPSSQFKEALTFFLPTLIGSLGGLAFGGTEAAVAGGKAGTELGGAFRKHQLEKQKLATPKAGKLDITPGLQTKDTKEVVFTRENPVTRVPEMFKLGPDGNPVPVKSSNVEDIKYASQVYRQTETSKRHGESIKESDERSVETAIKDFTKDDLIKKMKGARDTMTPMIKLLKSGMNVTPEFIAPFIARGVQMEVGALQKTDLDRARVPQSVARKIASDAKAFFAGDMSQEEREATVRLLEYLQKQQEDILNERAEGYVTAGRAERLGMDRKTMLQEMRNQLGLKGAEDRSQSNVRQRIQSRSAEENRRRLDELRSKRGGR